MKVGIDCHYIGSKTGGNETYTKNLVDYLAQIDQTSKYYLYFNNPNDFSEKLKRWNNFQISLIRFHTPWVRVPISLPIKLLMHNVDLVHVQYIAPPLCPCKFVVTIHDISWKHHPEIIPKSIYFAHSRLVASTARRAKIILTVSEVIKQDVIDTFNIHPDKIVVTYNGVKDIFKPISDKNKIEDVLKKYNLPNKYLLYVGRLELRKNLDRLIKAFDLLKKEKNIEHKLVIVGPQTWLYSKIFQTVTDLNLKKDVIFLGYVAENDLPAIYNGAELFISPSIIEGFGIPPVEAMACGTPVIVSDIPAHREVISNAGILTDPFDIDDMSRSVYNLLTNIPLRNEMREKGIKRAQFFSWEKTAQKTLEIYREVSLM